MLRKEDMLLVLIALINWITNGGSIPIDNGVIGIPQVECGDEMVTMRFNTERPFNGRIFVKGMSDKDRCVTTYRSNTLNTIAFNLKAGQCNMRRQRRLGPTRGVEQSMTVILSFHDTFITKVDKAYRCTCFFMEADKVVTADFTVSMLPTTDLFDTARMPACRYTVRRNSITGPAVNYARVGETLYHVWDCDSDMFGMLVHSCFVDDGTGSGKFQLLDQNGCAIDPVILGDLTYNAASNRATVEAHAFKFADKVTTYFQCAISLCMKNDGACVGLTPPVCNRRARFRREVNIIREIDVRSYNRDLESDMDVSAQKLYILDLDDDDESEEEDLDISSARENRIYAAKSRSESNALPPRPEVCLSAPTFGFMLSAFLLIITVAISAAAFLCIRQRSMNAIKP